MKVLLIGDEDLPQRNLIASLLDFHPRIQRINYALQTGTLYIAQAYADCFIYVDRIPNQSLIDKLDTTNCPLVLVADTDYHSQLFIHFDHLVTSFAKALGIFIENIDAFASLCEMEGEGDLLLPIIPGEMTWKLSQLCGNNDSHILDKLSDERKQFLYHLCEGTSKGQRHEEIYSALWLSKPTYYRILGDLKSAFRVSTNAALIQKMTVLMRQGVLKPSAREISP